MENYDDVIFEEDEFAEETPNDLVNDNKPKDETSDTQPNNNEGEDTLTNEALKYLGITNPEKIKFLDEDGSIVERSWDSLSRNELINILTNSDSEETQLNNEEIELLNSIRTSGMSVLDYLNTLKTPIELPEHYDIEQLSDEDVYALDLLEKVGSDNVTDEEITAAVESAKLNEELFKKTVSGLRNEYIRLQKDREALAANELAARQEAEYNKFATSIMGEIRGLNSFAGSDLELSKLDVDDLSAYILSLDESGTSAFGRALQDPNKFTKAAFWLLNEDKIVEELTRLMLETYRRGYETAKNDLSKPKVVISPKNKTTTTSDFIDDDDW